MSVAAARTDPANLDACSAHDSRHAQSVALQSSQWLPRTKSSWKVELNTTKCARSSRLRAARALARDGF
eukprot:918798-Prymnesium_polylepis.1